MTDVGNRTISEIAFDLWAKEDALLDRLCLAAPERHEAGTQCWQYAGTTLDGQKREIVHTFSRGVGTRQWSFRPWEGGRPDFEPVLEVTIHTLRIKAKEAWDSASDALDASVADGRVVISGRAGSPLNEPQSIPSPAWSFVEVDDWSAATGEGQGMGQIFDLRETAPHKSDRSGAEKVGRVVGSIQAELAEIYPNGVPAHLTDLQVHGDVTKHFEAKGIRRKPSLDSVKRAVKRRK